VRVATCCADKVVCLQETDAKRPVAEDPSMQRNMEKLKGQFPHVSYGRIQNLLAAHEGCIIQTSRVCLSPPQYLAAGPLNWVITHNIVDDMLQHQSCREVSQYTK